MDVGAPELLVILVVVLVLFGGAQLPRLARSIGEAQREFRRSSTDSSAASTDGRASAPPLDAEAPRPS